MSIRLFGATVTAAVLLRNVFSLGISSRQIYFWSKVVNQALLQELLITELMLDNKFHLRSPAEIAALLSVTTCQQRGKGNKSDDAPLPVIDEVADFCIFCSSSSVRIRRYEILGMFIVISVEKGCFGSMQQNLTSAAGMWS